MNSAVARGEGHVAKDGPLVVLTGQHTGRSATDKFVVRDAATENHVWWDNNKAMTPAHFDALYADDDGLCRRAASSSSKDLFGGADLTPSPAGARRHRICLALAVRPSSADPPHGRRAQGLRCRNSRSSICRASRPIRHAMAARTGTVIAVEFHQEARADRRHLLCRRDEEIGLHDPQLSAAAQARDADALLGQCRQGRQVGDLLRPLRHRQDDALGRCHRAR